MTVMDPPAQNALAKHNGNGGQQAPVPQTALAAMAARYQISQEGLVDVIRKTCIQGNNVTDAEFKAFVMVANQYGLNPLTREIHAFADPRKGIVPIVGIDGWARIVNRQPEFDGVEFADVGEGDDLGVTCTMFVKGRGHPVKVTEWLSECKRNTPPWNTMKRRMLRHKSFMQCARLAFSLSGIYDEDEARDVVHGPAEAKGESPTDKLNERLTQRPTSEGQTFVPDADAARNVEAQDAVEGEVIDRGTGEVDTSGSEAEAPADDVSTWKATVEAAGFAAMEAGLKPSDLEARLNLFVLAHRAKGKEEKTITPEMRRDLLAAVREGRLGADGKIQAKA